mgnify:CR=1 FL=1
MGELINTDAIQLFEDKKIRTAWDEEQEEWYFSIVDVISVLTGTENPRRYWSDLKRKLKKEGAVELYEKIVQLKMLSSDGKRYKTDVAIQNSYCGLSSLSLPRKPSRLRRGWQGWAGNGLTKPLTRNRPLTGR